MVFLICGNLSWGFLSLKDFLAQELARLALSPPPPTGAPHALPDRLCPTQERWVAIHPPPKRTVLGPKAATQILSQENNRRCTIFSPRGTVMLDSRRLFCYDGPGWTCL